MVPKRERLDVLLTEMGHFDSRERARRAIMAGVVSVDGQVSDKPGVGVERSSAIVVRSNPLRFVSRGGLKLEKALQCFSLDVSGLVAVDVGASTGGFTDCLLQSGAAKVYAIDVGYGQLSWSLRTDPRVVPIERTNIRYLDLSLVVDVVDIVTVDTAFISVTKFSGKMWDLLRPGGLLVLLIKPQFEAGRDKVGKKGVVRDPDVHCAVILGVLSHYIGAGFTLHGLTYSPVKGPEGNVEFLALMRRTDAEGALNPTEESASPIAEGPLTGVRTGLGQPMILERVPELAAEVVRRAHHDAALM